MCGQCGLILGQKRRTRKELETLSGIFTNLLLLNEARGRDATGIYMGNKDGSGQILKDAVPANFFVELARYRELMLTPTVTLSNTVMMMLFPLLPSMWNGEMWKE
ncbi:hypothetical protein [Victivallis vadensis]|uniref:hypothetical protein n=1 Tax=Victivallis vadensis TaxID=172901 RepID=UPI003CFD5AAB